MKLQLVSGFHVSMGLSKLPDNKGGLNYLVTRATMREKKIFATVASQESNKQVRGDLSNKQLEMSFFPDLKLKLFYQCNKAGYLARPHNQGNDQSSVMLIG